MAKNRGFTLIELLVVITIIAILTVIGMAVYSGLQTKSRDAKRKGDIEAISKALETNYNVSSGQYIKPDSTHFAGGGVPEDPKATGVACLTTASDFFYCIYTFNSGGSETYHGALTGSVPATFEKYTICAHVENANTGNSTNASGTAGVGSYFCRKNQQ